MKAMILAAGRGTRMLPLTANTPKPLLRAGGRALIEHHLLRLAAAGFTRVVINVSCFADRIVAYLGEGERYQLEIDYSREPEPLETAGAIRHARDKLGDGPFLLLNGDVYSDYPLERLRHRKLPDFVLAHLVLVDNPRHNPDGDYRVTEAGVLVSKLAPVASPAHTFSGISLIHPALLRRYPCAQEKSPLRDVFSRAIEDGAISAETYGGEWMDVGTPERLHALRQRLEARVRGPLE